MSFTKRDRQKLNTCHGDLIRLFEAVERKIAIGILEGRRTVDRQLHLFQKGRIYDIEKNEWVIIDKKRVVTNCDGLKIKSAHNYDPSNGIDTFPIPLDWTNISAFNNMCDIIKSTADELHIEIKQGRDWGDYPHTELIGVDNA